MKNTFKDNSEINVGVIFQIQAGYSMLIPRFFLVVSKSGAKTLKVQELELNILSGNGMQGECIPAGTFKNRPMVSARISKHGMLSIDGHYAWLWDGKPSMYDFMD